MNDLLKAQFCRKQLPPAEEEGVAKVLLTFDDGPTPGITEQILDILDQWNCRAIFFVVGKKAEKAPELLLDTIKRGHYLGNHSYSHDGRYFPEPIGYCRDIRRCSDVIREISGVEPRFFRAPAGRIHLGSMWISLNPEMKHLLWSLDSDDWRVSGDTGIQHSTQKVLRRIRSRDIILFHDYKVESAKILQHLMPRIAAQGFDFSSWNDAWASQGVSGTK